MGGNYKPLAQEDSENSEKDSVDHFHYNYVLSLSSKLIPVLLLIVSLLCNAILLYYIFALPKNEAEESLTTYAGLKRDTLVTFSNTSPFTSSNQTLQDEAWSSSLLDPAIGMVALSDEWTSTKHLPPAQRWPWDHSKGIYLLNGFHNIHCLHILRRFTHETFAHKAHQTSPREHIDHCLNILREEIMCNADDTPWYTGRVNEQEFMERPVAGVGQKSMCRDWEALRRWALEKSACYRPVGKGVKRFPVRERYKFCPDGSRPWEGKD